MKNLYESTIFLKEAVYSEKPQYLKYDKNLIDLNRLFEVTRNLPIHKNLDIGKVNYNSPEVHIGSSDKAEIKKHEERSMNTDITVPVLVIMGDNGKYDLLDGWHRVWKALKLKRSISYKIVPLEVLKKAFVIPDSDLYRAHMVVLNLNNIQR